MHHMFSLEHPCMLAMAISYNINLQHKCHFLHANFVLHTLVLVKLNRDVRFALIRNVCLVLRE